jgi:hypothetical protein
MGMQAILVSCNEKMAAVGVGSVSLKQSMRFVENNVDPTGRAESLPLNGPGVWMIDAPACRFAAKPGGCRNGSTCRFRHSLLGSSEASHHFKLPADVLIHICSLLFALVGHFNCIVRFGSVCQHWRRALYDGNQASFFWTALCSMAVDLPHPSRGLLLDTVLGLGTSCLMCFSNTNVLPRQA